MTNIKVLIGSFTSNSYTHRNPLAQRHDETRFTHLLISGTNWILSCHLIYSPPGIMERLLTLAVSEVKALHFWRRKWPQSLIISSSLCLSCSWIYVRKSQNYCMLLSWRFLETDLRGRKEARSDVCTCLFCDWVFLHLHRCSTLCVIRRAMQGNNWGNKGYMLLSLSWF